MALEVQVEKTYGDFHLKAEFQAEEEPLALLGPPGCGKSLTLKCIAGIERPDRGRIVLDGQVLFDSERRIDLPPQKRQVGYLFQQYALFPHMTVAENIAGRGNPPAASEAAGRCAFHCQRAPGRPVRSGPGPAARCRQCT